MTTHFTVLSRILHWLMAALILAMLFIGVAMVSSLSDYHGWCRSISRSARCSWCWSRSG